MCVTPVLADDTHLANMQILINKVKADTKHVFADNMNLTEQEAKEFWPL